MSAALPPTLKGHSHMTRRASLLRQLENSLLSRNQKAELGCQIAKQLEDVGDYEGASVALDYFWRGMGERPIQRSNAPLQQPPARSIRHYRGKER